MSAAVLAGSVAIAIGWTRTAVAYDDSASFDATRDLPKPQREQELIALLLNARKQYDAAAPGQDRTDARLQMQIALLKFLNAQPEIEGWTGVVRQAGPTREGDRWIKVEIGPGILVGTWESRVYDPDLVTLIEPHMELYQSMDRLKVGDPVMFSARILAARTSSDDEMVDRPELIARFSALGSARLAENRH